MSKVKSRAQERFIKSHYYFTSDPTSNLLLRNLLNEAQLFHLKPKGTVPEHSIINSSCHTQCIYGLLLQQGRANIPQLSMPKCL